MSGRPLWISHICLSLLLPVSGGWLGECEATLYVYRIGGEDAPPPEFPDQWDVAFVSIPWSSVDEELFGAAHRLDMSQSSIGPVRIEAGVNQTPLVRDRGGWIWSVDGFSWGEHEPTLALLGDQDLNTAYFGFATAGGGLGTCWTDDLPEIRPGKHRQCFDVERIFRQYGGQSRGIWINLGGLFPIRTVVLHATTSRGQELSLSHFLIGSNDGDPLKIGYREAAFWVGLHELFVDFDMRHLVFANNAARVELDMGDVPVENIIFETTGFLELAEIEVYGDGFSPRATYTSNILDLEKPAALGELSWSGDRPEGTDVLLRMRSGNDEDPRYYWRYTFRGDERTRFDDEGRLLTQATYEALEGGEKAGITPDTGSWEFWTPPVEFAKRRVELAGERPRQFVQFEAEFLSDKPVEARSVLDFLQFEVSKPPVVSQVLAEIEPLVANPREVTRFSYRILPEFEADDQGFDSIQIDTPARVVSVDTLILSSADSDNPEGRDTLDVSAAADVSDSGFIIPLPAGYRRDQQSTGLIIEIIFRAPVYQYGFAFSGRVFDSDRPWEVRQRVTPGDADPTVESSSLIVELSDLGASSVDELELSSAVLTPNSDGINDVLEIGFELVNLAGSVPIEIGVYDLSGRRVTRIVSAGASGKFSEAWDGTDGDGTLLPPGLYVIRMAVTSDEATDIATTTVALAY